MECKNRDGKVIDSFPKEWDEFYDKQLWQCTLPVTPEVVAAWAIAFQLEWDEFYGPAQNSFDGTWYLMNAVYFPKELDSFVEGARSYKERSHMVHGNASPYEMSEAWERMQISPRKILIKGRKVKSHTWGGWESEEYSGKIDLPNSFAAAFPRTRQEAYEYLQRVVA